MDEQSSRENAACEEGDHSLYCRDNGTKKVCTNGAIIDMKPKGSDNEMGNLDKSSSRHWRQPAEAETVKVEESGNAGLKSRLVHKKIMKKLRRQPWKKHNGAKIEDGPVEKGEIDKI